MSASASAAPTITTTDISLLVRGYCHDNLHQRGEAGLLEQVLEQGRCIFITDWSLSEVGAQLFCLVDPISPQPWVLRITVTAAMLWLGLHAIQTSAPISLEEYPQLLWDAVSTSPLTMGMMAHRSLHFDEWVALLRALFAHVGSIKGSLALAIPIMAVNTPAMPADVPVLIPPALRDVLEFTMADFVPQVVQPPPPKPVYDHHYGGGVMITGQDGKEVPRKNWRY